MNKNFRKLSHGLTLEQVNHNIAILERDLTAMGAKIQPTETYHSDGRVTVEGKTVRTWK
jgi:hypothetical protein